MKIATLLSKSSPGTAGSTSITRLAITLIALGVCVSAASGENVPQRSRPSAGHGALARILRKRSADPFEGDEAGIDNPDSPAHSNYEEQVRNQVVKRILMHFQRGERELQRRSNGIFLRTSKRRPLNLNRYGRSGLYLRASKSVPQRKMIIPRVLRSNNGLFLRSSRAAGGKGNLFLRTMRGFNPNNLEEYEDSNAQYAAEDDGLEGFSGYGKRSGLFLRASRMAELNQEEPQQDADVGEYDFYDNSSPFAQVPERVLRSGLFLRSS